MALPLGLGDSSAERAERIRVLEEWIRSIEGYSSDMYVV